MGKPFIPLYGNTDVGSAIEDIEKAVAVIKSNKFNTEDLIKLHNANAELIKAILNNEYED